MSYTTNQRKAIETKGSNIIVSAGAGSGKTGVLKARVIEKLKQGIHIDQLIILTFTNAAAAEMRTRIIDEIKNDPELALEMKRMSRAVISTFDAFCLKLVRQYHYLLGLPADINIGDTILIKKMEQEVLEEVMKFYYQNGDAEFDQMVIDHFQAGDRLIWDTVKSIGDKLLKEPNWEKRIDEYEKTYYNLDELNWQFSDYENEFLRMANEIKSLVRNMKDVLSQYHLEYIDNFLGDLDSSLQNLFEATDYSSLYSAVILVGLPRKPSTRDEAIKQYLNDSYTPIRNLIKKMQETITLTFAENRSKAIESVLKTKKTVLLLMDVVKSYLMKLTRTKKERNLFNFQDIMDLTIRLLEEQTEVREGLKGSIDEIMVDEYQDTNDMQDYLISLLEENNVFMVGDIKQSIYGFRDANPKNFHDRYLKYRNNEGGIAIDLRENFRSRQEVLRDVNITFNRTMSEYIGGIDYMDNQSLVYGQTAYNALAQHQFYGMEVLKYSFNEIKENKPESDKMAIEAELMAKDIRNRIDNGYQIIEDFKTKKFRKLRYSDIAILIDRKTDFEKISTILSKHNIPVNLYSDEPFVESPEMLFLTSYLKLLKCFMDEEYLKENFTSVFYSVARSFVYKIKDQDILDIIINHEFTKISDLDMLMDNKNFVSLHSTASALAKEVENLSNRELIEKIYFQLGVFKAISSLDNPGKKAEKLDYFALNAMDISGFDFDDLISYLELIDKNEDWDIEYSPAHPHLEAVKLMTMHKSKGLQFPIVYVAGLGKQFNFKENKDFFIYDKEYGLIANVMEEGYYPTYQRFLYLQEARRIYVSERIRLLYVTMTRAQENLILVLNNDDFKEGLQEVGLGGYIKDDIRMEYNRYSDLLSSVNIFSLKEPHYHDQIREDIEMNDQVKETGKIHYRQFDFRSEELTKDRYSKSSSTLLNDDIIASIEYGDMIHRMLEDFDYTNIDISISKLPPRIASSIRKLLDSDILGLGQNPEIYQEVEFVHENETGLHHGIIDLMTVTKTKAVIVDYKSSNLDDDAYERQLAGYRDYVGKTLKVAVECYLFSILGGELRKIF